jgi:hypothetical protein
MTLPSPEDERKAIVAFTAFAVLSLLGAGALLFAIATVLVKAAQWVWSF